MVSRSLENDSSSDDEDDVSRLVPGIGLFGVIVTVDEFIESSGCSSGDVTSSLWGVDTKLIKNN